MFDSLKIVPTSVYLESSERDVKFLVAVGDEVLVIRLHFCMGVFRFLLVQGSGFRACIGFREGRTLVPAVDVRNFTRPGCGV